MKIKIEKGRASGKIDAPKSKSMAHRLLIAAALARGKSTVAGISLCEDVLATVDCLSALGAEIKIDGDVAEVRGIDPRSACARGVLCARESGSTLRFMIPIAMLSGNEAIFTGAERLLERPMSVYEDLACRTGITFERLDGRIKVRGPIGVRDFYLPGNISSQFITGLLFILPLLGGERRIHITTKIESRSYLDLTLSAMREFGISAEWENDQTLLVRPGSYKNRCVEVEGDWSGAAFPDALNLLGGRVEISGLSDKSLQGDKIYRRYFSELLSGTPTLSLEDCPDLAPILFTLAAALSGGRFTGTARLRIKESDRGAVMAEELAKFGAEVSVEENSVTVRGGGLHAPDCVLCGHNDHRIVMSLAVLCTLFGGVIDGAEAIKKSYPEFFEDLLRLGIKVNEI